MRLDELKRDAHNRRKHNPRNLGMIADALRQVGASRSIVIDETGEILAGNGLVEAASTLGLSQVQVVDADGETVVAVRRSGLTEAQKRALAVFDNRTAELAEWDWDRLAQDQAEGLTLEPWWTPEELAEAWPAVPKAGLTDPDAVPAVRVTEIRRGDLFELGRHRLLCGDSTVTADVARVLPERADLVFTSPPYGAGNVAKLRDHYVPGQKNRESFYEGHDDDPTTWRALMEGWFSVIRPRVEAVVCNLQLLADNKRFLIEWLSAHRADFCDLIVWDKIHAAPQMQQRVLSNAFELLLVFGGNASRAIPFAEFHGTVANMVRINARGTNEVSDVHRAVMPVALPLWVLNELCTGAKTIAEPFGGTGTTLMAAEQTKRQCLGLEIEPLYVQVTLDRWEQFTGEKAVKVGEAVRYG